MKKKRRRRGSNRGAVWGVSAVVAFLLIGLTVQSKALAEKNRTYEEQVKELEKQIEEEKARTDEIAELEEYMQSQEYVEQIAKDKLGLAYEGEIIFKPEG